MISGKERMFKFIAVFLVFFLFLSAEIVGHIIYYFTHEHVFRWQALKPDNPFNVYTMYFYMPNIKINMQGYPCHLKTNSFGFVSTFNDPKKDQNLAKIAVFKIAIIGGSTVEGRGATSNETTIAGFMQRILGEKVYVINAGLSGSNSYTDVRIFEGLLLTNNILKPDLVIFFNGRNDIYTFFKYYPYSWKPNWHEYFPKIERSIKEIQLNPLKDVFSSMDRFLDMYSILYASMKKIFEKFKFRKPYKREFGNFTEEDIDVGVKNWFINMETACYRAKLEGIRCMYIIQPILNSYFKNLTSYEQKNMEQWLKSMGISENLEAAFLERMRKYCKKSQYCVDASLLFYSENGTLYYDNCHYTDKGNELIAKFLVKEIRKNVYKMRF